jgi:hypothetical protein
MPLQLYLPFSALLCSALFSRLIIADGQVSPEDLQDTKNSIVEASNFAISIVMVGVGVRSATSLTLSLTRSLTH